MKPGQLRERKGISSEIHSGHLQSYKVQQDGVLLFHVGTMKSEEDALFGMEKEDQATRSVVWLIKPPEIIRNTKNRVKKLNK